MVQRDDTGSVQLRCDGKINQKLLREKYVQLCLCLGIKSIEQKIPRYLFFSVERLVQTSNL